MAWLSLDVLIRVGIPLLTFFLGVLATFLLRFIERQAVEQSLHVQAIAKLTRDWFNQLSELALEIEFNQNPDDVRRAIAGYIQSRVILPELMTHLQYVRGAGLPGQFLSEIHGFLTIVTATRDHADGTRLNLFSPEFDATARLEVLDQKLQRIAVLAGDILVAERRPLELWLNALLERSAKRRARRKWVDLNITRSCLPPDEKRRRRQEALRAPIEDF